MFMRNGIVVKFNKKYGSVRAYGGQRGLIIGTGMALENMVNELRKEGLPEEVVRKIIVQMTAMALSMDAPQVETDEDEPHMAG